MSKQFLVGLSVGTLLLAACAPQLLPSDDPGQTAIAPPGDVALSRLDVTVTLPKAQAAQLKTSPADVAAVWISATWSGGATPEVSMYEVNTYTYQLTLENLPANTPLTISARAVAADGRTVYTGTRADIILSSTEVASVRLDLRATDSGSSAGRAPLIVKVSRPTSAVLVGQAVAVDCTVQDADDATLQYAFTSSGDGAFAPASGNIALVGGSAVLHTTYRAPSTPGNAELVLRVEDPRGLSAQYSFVLTVIPLPEAYLPGTLELDVNFPPTIEGITARQIQNGALIELLAQATDETPADELAYVWTANGHTFDTDNPATYPPNQGNVPMTLRVADPRGAATVVLFNLDTAATTLGDLPLTNRAPQIVLAALSSRQTAYGDPVQLVVYTTDPDGDVLTAQWSSDRGSMADPTAESAGGYTVCRAIWQPDVAAGLAHITVQITDPGWAAAIYVFTVEETLGRVGLQALAGPDRGAHPGNTVRLDGSASASEDGVIRSYRWEQLVGPASVIADPTAAVTTVKLTDLGTYTYRLTVQNVNNVASDTITFIAADPLLGDLGEMDSSLAGIIYLLVPDKQQVRRYDAHQHAFLPPWSTAPARPTHLAATPAGDAVYVACDGGRILTFDPANDASRLFAIAPTSVRYVLVVGPYLLAGEPDSYARTLYSRATGARLSTATTGYTSSAPVYAPTQSRLYYVDSNSIVTEDVDEATNTLKNRTVHDVGSSLSGRPHLYPDASRIIVGSKIISVASFQVVGGLGTSQTDVDFWADRIVIIRGAGNYDDTDLLVLAPDLTVAQVATVPGDPMRVFVYGNEATVIGDNYSRFYLTPVALED